MKQWGFLVEIEGLGYCVVIVIIFSFFLRCIGKGQRKVSLYVEICFVFFDYFKMGFRFIYWFWIYWLVGLMVCLGVYQVQRSRQVCLVMCFIFCFMVFVVIL